MSVLARVLSVLRTIFTRLVAGVRWLARQTRLQRSLGVAQSPQLTRLLDVHALTVAAHLTLIVAILVTRNPVESGFWVFAGLVAVALTALAIWRAGRLMVGLLTIVQAIGTLVAIQGAGEILPFLVALAIAQQSALIVVWIRNGAHLPALGRATAYGFLLGVFTGGSGLIVGFFAHTYPLWVAAILLIIAATVSVKLPDPGPRPRVPRQQPPKAPGSTPEGFAVYRPSSLDE